MTAENKTNIEFKLLNEAIWNVEDKLRVGLDCIAEHKAELIRLNQITNLFEKRLVRLEKKGGKKR